MDAFNTRVWKKRRRDGGDGTEPTPPAVMAASADHDPFIGPADVPDDQGSFWEYHGLVFANQSAIDVDSLKGYADQLGLDTATFNDCLDAGTHTEEVQKDSRDTQSCGATGTPAFFING